MGYKITNLWHGINHFLEKRSCLKKSLLFFMIISLYGMYQIHSQKYQMYFTYPTGDSNDPHWPNKRIWFDASEWLNTSRYIKINGNWLLNLQYIPISDEEISGPCVLSKIKDEIKHVTYHIPELAKLSSMDDASFYRLVKNTVSYEYLLTKFDNETLKPTYDLFLVYFSYQNQKYEIEMYRVPLLHDEKIFAFKITGHSIRKSAGVNNAKEQYFYRDYLTGRKIKTSIRTDIEQLLDRYYIKLYNKFGSDNEK